MQTLVMSELRLVIGSIRCTCYQNGQRLVEHLLPPIWSEHEATFVCFQACCYRDGLPGALDLRSFQINDEKIISCVGYTTTHN